MDLSKLTYLDAKKAMLLCDAVIVPLGSIEQHGYALPLNTDNVICTSLVNDLCRKFRLCHLPIVSFGQTWSSSNYSGTISIDANHFESYIHDIVMSLEKFNTKRIIFYSFHNGNQESIKHCARKLAEEYQNIYFLHSNEIGKMCTDIITSSLPSGIWHAGEIEASLMMYLAPDLVHTDKFCEGEILDNISDVKPIKWDRFNTSGSFGSTVAANAEKGKEIYGRLLELISSQIIRILSDQQKISGVKLLVTDVDGTLVNSNSEISADTIRAFQLLKKRNIKICLSTGRNLHMTKGIIKEIGGEIFSISDNGAYVYDHCKDRLIYEKNILYADARFITDFLLKENCSFIAYSDTAMLYSCMNEFVGNKIEGVVKDERKYNFEKKLKFVHVQNDKDIADYNHFLKIVIITESKDEVERLRLKFKDCDISFTKTGKNIWAICHSAVSKEYGTKVLQEYLSMGMESTVAFGDYDNDLPLFKCARYKVAMENASDAMIRNCNFMTCSNEEDGVAKFIGEMII